MIKQLGMAIFVNFFFPVIVSREKLMIPYDKPCIILQGEGKMNTFVEWDDHETTSQSPTFSTMADNIVVKHISFRVRN